MSILRLNSHDIDQGLSTLDHWTLDAHKASIRKEWEFDSFQTAMRFMVKVGDIAEQHNHHPEFLSTYTKVRIRLLTHDAKGLTQLDFKLAYAIDQLINHDFLNAFKAK
jgi:4a-hydroxytetrahydrobiopterin dehydratase